MGQLANLIIALDAEPARRKKNVIEVEMPLGSDWNGRFYMVDNAGSGGRINYRRMANARHMGYASASTDQGYDAQTEGGDLFGYNNRQKEIDFGFRAVHVTAETAKAVIEAFYSRPAEYSYFVGGSAGGRQALFGPCIAIHGGCSPTISAPGDCPGKRSSPLELQTPS